MLLMPDVSVIGSVSVIDVGGILSGDLLAVESPLMSGREDKRDTGRKALGCVCVCVADSINCFEFGL